MTLRNPLGLLKLAFNTALVPTQKDTKILKHLSLKKNKKLYCNSENEISEADSNSY